MPPAIVTPQRNFSAGQIDHESLRRDDTELYGAALRRGLNVELVATGGFRRRPGTEALFFAGGVNFWARPVSGKRFKITLTGETFTARLIGEVIHTTLTGCPWTADMVAGLDWQTINRDILVTHADGAMRPQVIRYDEATDTWSRSDFAFATGLNNAKRQPYYRFGGSGITLTPSARTGSITVTASAAYFQSGHVGVDFLYGGLPGIATGRAFRVTAYTSPTQVTADVIETLPPTYRVIVASSAGYQIGEVVEGENSGTKGVIVGIDVGGSNRLNVLVAFNYAGFVAEEKVISPSAHSETPSSSWQTELSPAAAHEWSEAFMSDLRGWPGSVALDVQRLIFTRFRQLRNAACWSAISSFEDFHISGQEDGAIFETIAADVTIFHILGGYDQFAFTDRGIYYIPISGASPLVAGSVEFRKIESDGASPVKPIEVEGAHVFANAGGTSILAIRATGQAARPYIVEDISRYHRDLIREPVALAATTSEASSPERYLYAVNADGTIAAARYERREGGEGWVGWVPWTTAGAVTHAFGQFGDLLLTVTRGETGVVEQLTGELPLDGARFLPTGRGVDALEVSDGVFLEVGDGGILEIGGDGILTSYAGQSVALWKDEQYYGSFTVADDGTLPDGPADVALVWAGFDYPVDVAFFVPGADGGQSVGQRMKRRRVKRGALTIHESQTGFEFMGRIEAAYRIGENQEEPPPVRSETIRRRALGTSFDPVVNLSQTFPARLHVLEVAIEAGV